ncbi:pilus assembly protein TadG-related protein [Corallococcus aberystwythensis]|uniref:pilus assembly protein TadG-related protein n=1 Tax=Corallococcus aberystwythensis TaxID=2316722 RepID=UPI001ABF507C|nr:pilus assembly protein TadG-related protein [Corallococcus aberystwythensis]
MSTRPGWFTRGQTLVLFALTLLLLTVMVCMTLSMGSKVKERMELQTLADASAYSSAVATARAYNAVAVMNRVQVAHAVSTLGTLSLISWSTLYWKHADNAATLFQLMAVPYAFNTVIQCIWPPKPLCRPCANGLAQSLALAVLATNHANRTRSKLRQDNELFAAETLPRWNAAQRIHEAQVEVLARARERAGNGPTGFAQQYLNQARLTAPGEVQVQPAGTDVTGRELADAVFDHAAPVHGEEPHEVGHIVMGSRGHPFLRDRAEGKKWDRFASSDSLSMRAYTLYAGGHIFFSSSRNGKGYYDAGFTTNPSGRPYDPRAHDGEGGRTRTAFVALSPVFGDWVRCQSPIPAYVISIAVGLVGRDVDISDAQVSTTQHNGVGHGAIHAFQTFPPFVDFNGSQVADAQNLRGQPKLVTALSRDYVPERDVWDLSFNFRFTPADRRVDLSGGQYLGGPPHQVAVGSGVAYYHRFGHSSEPPNLFAPYWRAGLTRFSVDRPDPGQPTLSTFDGQTDDFLSGTGSSGAQGALESLRANGYVAW